MIIVRKIISGGQTGADRAALDFAAKKGFQTGGYVPSGRRAEDGALDGSYHGMTETRTANYAERTALNVRESDATLIVSRGQLSGGSGLTRTLAERYGRPVLHIDLSATSPGAAAAEVREWLSGSDCRVLNVAGPRASTDSGIYDAVMDLLDAVFQK